MNLLSNYYSSRKSLWLLAFGAVSIFFVQCKKETTDTSGSAKLNFSTNSILFDTVFTSLGSTVRAFTVSNPYNQPIVISSIQLQGSYTSPFKINVDGVPGTSFSNIKIPANDSIFVFVTVTINPTNADNPIVIDDNLNFTTNGNLQTVQLEAWGQNAYFYYPNIFPPAGKAYSVLPCGTSTLWRNDKPHVIYGYLIVNSGCTLTMEPGTKVYLHDSAVLYISPGATLNIEGNSFDPVTFQGDRLEPEYQYIPGQWGEIYLAPLSVNNHISWAVMINGIAGVVAETNAGNGEPALMMDNTIIKNMSEIGLLGQEATITADNCLIADCQDGCAYLQYGGTYTFNQCTFADYWGVYNGYATRTTPLLYINNYYVNDSGRTISSAIYKAFFGNCIIYGSLNEELGLDSGGTNNKFNYYFENCLLKTQQNTSITFHYDSNLVNQDPQFNNPSLDDYQISVSSPAVGYAKKSIAENFTTDLDGEPRTPPYAIGAYQPGTAHTVAPSGNSTSSPPDTVSSNSTQ